MLRLFLLASLTMKRFAVSKAVNRFERRTQTDFIDRVAFMQTLASCRAAHELEGTLDRLAI